MHITMNNTIPVFPDQHEGNTISIPLKDIIPLLESYLRRNRATASINGTYSFEDKAVDLIIMGSVCKQLGYAYNLFYNQYTPSEGYLQAYMDDCYDALRYKELPSWAEYVRVVMDGVVLGSIRL